MPNFTNIPMLLGPCLVLIVSVWIPLIRIPADGPPRLSTNMYLVRCLVNSKLCLESLVRNSIGACRGDGL